LAEAKSADFGFLENIEQPTFNPEHPMKRMFGFFSALDVRCWMFPGLKNNKSLPNLSIGQGQMGESAFASLSFLG
jgi:hypothetical protein